MLNKKSILITVIFILFAIPFVKGSFLQPSQSAYGSGSSTFTTYEMAIKDNKPTVILFYTDWCTYCRRFIPKFNSVAASNSDKFNFVKINIEKPQKNIAIANQYGIRSIPTVYIVDSRYKIKKQVSSNAQVSAETFQNELNRYFKQRR